MIRHALHSLVGAAGLALVALPAVLVDPAARHLLERHPVLAAYLAAGAGIARALDKAKTERDHP